MVVPRAAVIAAVIVAVAACREVRGAGGGADTEASQPPATFINSIGMKLVLVEEAEVVIGASETDRDAQKDEKPQHRVRISRPYYVAAHETTVGQFRAFVEATGFHTAAENEPSSGFDADAHVFQYERLGFHWRHVGWPQTDNHPVLNVSWVDCNQFCTWLSKKEGRSYRLPSEAEWEGACRGGEEKRFIASDSVEVLKTLANVQDESLALLRPRFSNSESSTYLAKAVPWNDGFAFSAPVGSFRPNTLGLYDMLGNAAEWCSDWYGADYYAKSPAIDPAGPANGEGRVVRGGAFLHRPEQCRVTQRIGGRPSYHNYIIGFRVVTDSATPR